MFEWPLKNNRFVLCISVFLLCAVPLCANDIAWFQNLGFSANGNYFMFGQYGISEENSKPYAESYIIDVGANKFIPGGAALSSHAGAALPGENGLGALFNLLHQQAGHIREYDIDHLLTGRLIYLLVNGNEPKSEINFRDFNTENSYTIRLIQNFRGTADASEAAFHIVLTQQTSDGNERSYTIGLPDFFRKNVSRYAIKQVLLSPDERSVIIVIEKISDSSTGIQLRYMVETAQLSY